MQKIFFLIVSLSNISLFGVTRILLTAALIDAHYEFRKNQYIKSVHLLKSFGFENVYIVESLKKRGPTFLDELSTNVFYAQSNNLSLRNQGINEALTTLEALEHFQFSDDDIIVKFTGRYYVLSDYFLKLIEENKNNYDVFVKRNELDYTVTLGYACKCGLLKEILRSMDYGKIEREYISIEHPFGDYIKHQAAIGRWRVCVVDKLDVQADIFGSSTAPGAPAITYYF